MVGYVTEMSGCSLLMVFFFQAEDGIRGGTVTGVQTCALPIFSAPIRNSPRSVWEMYTCICDETMITSRNGFSGSVTNACRMCVVIGSGTPARSATSVDHPAVALITVPALTSPRL